MLPTNWIVQFSATRCWPCKQQTPILQDISTETGVEFVKVDVEAIPELADQFNISKVPTTIILKWGVEQERFVWAQQKETIIDALHTYWLNGN